MSCDACSFSRRTVRPACRCCPDNTVVVADDAACVLISHSLVHLDELLFIAEQLQQLMQGQRRAVGRLR